MIQLVLTEEMQRFVDAQVAEGEYADASEYVTRLLRAEQKRQARLAFEALLQGDLDSGEDAGMGPAGSIFR